MVDPKIREPVIKHNWFIDTSKERGFIMEDKKYCDDCKYDISNGFRLNSRCLDCVDCSLWEEFEDYVFNKEQEKGDLMRDITRIRPFLEKIEELWKIHPDLRFGQLVVLMQYTGSVADIFHPEEDEWLQVINKLIEYKKDDNNG